MVLAFDIGNSNITIGVFDKNKENIDELTFMSRLITDRGMDAEAYADKIKFILASNNKTISDIEGAVICSVVPPVTSSVSAALEALTGKKPVIVDSDTDYGLTIQMDNPKKVGTDLLVGAGQALSKYEAPLCVVDLGTFTTLCYVSGEKEYQGTIIIPGIRTTADSYTRAAQLFSFEIDSPGALLGTNTNDSMLSGLMNGAASMIDGLVDRIEDEKGPLKTVVVTGGFSRLIVPLLKHGAVIDENLLLDGLCRLYYDNRG